MQKLISFIIPSRRLDNIKGFFENLEKTTSDPSCLEVLIKFDDDQAGVVDFIQAEINKRPFSIKYIITPRFEGIYSVWVAMEQLFFIADPNAHFVMVMSDEPRFHTQHWDKILRNYIGFFKDGVFRLRLSSMKFANYPSHYECTFRPDSFPIYTRRWLELTEGTGDCWGSDAYQQCVAFQLSLGPGSYLNIYREDAICRDVVVYDIELYGLEFCVGVPVEEQRERHWRNLREWNRLTTYVMQEHFSYLARRINAYIWAHQQGIQSFKIVKRENRRTVCVVNGEGQIIREISYGVPRLVVYTQNMLRHVLTYPRHMAIWMMSHFKQFLVKTGVVAFARKTALSLAKLPFLSEKMRNSLLRFGTKQADITDKPGLSLKRKIKNFILNTLLIIFSPIYFITKFIDRFLTQMPPGISALTRKPRIPKRIRKPDISQINWLKSELNSQKNKRSELRNKTFDNETNYSIETRTLISAPENN